jgi:hypothetical protein
MTLTASDSDRQDDVWEGAQPMGTSDQDAVARAARAGDETAFAALAERHRRELHVHCYRMMASFDEA